MAYFAGSFSTELFARIKGKDAYAERIDTELPSQDGGSFRSGPFGGRQFNQVSFFNGALFFNVKSKSNNKRMEYAAWFEPAKNATTSIETRYENLTQDNDEKMVTSVFKSFLPYLTQNCHF